MPREKGTGHKTGRLDKNGREITEWSRKEPQRASHSDDVNSLLDFRSDSAQKPNLDGASLLPETKLSDYDLSGYTADDPFTLYENGEELNIYTTDDGDIMYETVYEEDPRRNIENIIITDQRAVGRSSEFYDLNNTIIDDDLHTVYDKAVKDYLTSEENNVNVEFDSPEYDYQRTSVYTTFDPDSPEFKNTTMANIWDKFVDADNMYEYRTPDEIHNKIIEHTKNNEQFVNRSEAVAAILDNDNLDPYDYVDDLDSIDELVKKAKSNNSEVREYILGL